jgi:CubicO group peptidase (beta-lactamase class C family)
MTAAAFGLLVEEGKLDWDDRVADLLPGFAVSHSFVTREITIRDLLCHRSGVEDAPLLYVGSALDARQLLHRLRFLEQRASFRNAFVYNNLMYLALGFLLEEVSGSPYAEFLRDRLFAPLGMTRSSVGPAPSADGDVSAQHARFGDDVRVLTPDWGDLGAVAPAGAVRSSLKDLLQWTLMSLNRGKLGRQKILKPEILHEMHRLQTVTRVPRYTLPESQFQGYALGSHVGDHRGRKVLPTGGRVAGGTAEVMLVPESRFGVVVLGNMDMSLLGYALAFEAVDRFLGHGPADWSKKMLAWAEKAAPLSPRAHLLGPPSQSIEDYAGRYGHPLFGPVTVSWNGECLQLDYNREIRGELRHEAFDTFLLRSDENPLVDPRCARATFRHTPLGVLESLELSWPIRIHGGDLERVLFRRQP